MLFFSSKKNNQKQADAQKFNKYLKSPREKTHIQAQTWLKTYSEYANRMDMALEAFQSHPETDRELERLKSNKYNRRGYYICINIQNFYDSNSFKGSITSHFTDAKSMLSAYKLMKTRTTKVTRSRFGYLFYFVPGSNDLLSEAKYNGDGYFKYQGNTPKPTVVIDWSRCIPFIGALKYHENGKLKEFNWHRKLRRDDPPCFTVDSGYDGSMMLPMLLVESSAPQEPGWTYCGIRHLGLANGEKIHSVVYRGQIEWPPVSGNLEEILADVPLKTCSATDSVDQNQAVIDCLKNMRDHSWLIGCDLIFPGSICVREKPKTRTRKVFLFGT